MVKNSLCTQPLELLVHQVAYLAISGHICFKQNSGWGIVAFKLEVLAITFSTFLEAGLSQNIKNHIAVMDWKKKCCASGLATGSRASLSGCNVSSCSWENASFPTVKRETQWVASAKVFAESWNNSTAVRRPANFVEFQWPYFSQDRIFWQQWDRSCCLNFFMHNFSRISSTWYMFAQFHGPVAPRSSVRLVYTGKI